MLGKSSTIVKYHNFIFLIFLIILTIPGGISNAGIYFSHAPGMIIGASLIFISVVLTKRKLAISRESFLIIILIASILLLNYLLSMLFYGPLAYLQSGSALRFIFSYLILIYLIFAAHFLVEFLNSLSENQFDRLISKIYYILLVIALISLPMHYFDFVDRKQMIFFSEPSHFAIGFAPFYFYKVFNSSNYLIPILTTLILGFLLQNLTLLVICIMGLFIYFRKFNLRVFLLITLLSSLFLFYIFNFADSASFIVDRLNFFEEASTSSNLSLLILLSSYERAYLSFIETYGIGIGFQQMGYIGSMGSFQEIIMQMEGSYINVNDGGNLSSKLISELGFVGIIIICSYLIFFTKILRKVRLRKFLCKQKIFYYVTFLFFIILLFVRATSYFTPSSFLVLVAIIGLNSLSMKESKAS